MASVFHQVQAVTAMSVRTIPERLGTSLVVVAGIAGVVGVLVALLAMAEGFAATLNATGRMDRVMILRAGSIDEMGSGLTVEQTRLARDLQGIKRDAGGQPLALAEVYVVTNARKRGPGHMVLAVVRGTSTRVFDVRPEARIVAGRMFEPGKREVVVGKGAHRQYENMDIGQQVEVRDGVWTVVGIFESGGDVHESEMWVDASALQDASRSSTFNTVVARLEDDRKETFTAFKDRMTTDPRMRTAAHREPEYYASRSEGLKAFITVLGYTISSIMALGALFGALNTMYAAVATRGVEIATLRAIGFGGGPVVASVMIESVLLALVGALVGAAIAYVGFNGFQVSAVNIQTASNVAFAFRVTPALLVQGIVWALVIGFLGGLLPAVRAARMPVVEALRAG
ncbi:MAG TPA: ABC transporter permease [Nevskiaceae bacterium]|nr:ABC transporter permease [Nevskiaceae bacterium]